MPPRWVESGAHPLQRASCVLQLDEITRGETMSTVDHRLRRLRGNRLHFSILALDHGLTVGRTNESATLPVQNLLDSCSDYIGGFVVSYGVARTLQEWPVRVSIVLQCFGAPDPQSRRKITSIETAILLDAAAVSVQFTWSDIELGPRLSDVSAFTADAHSAGLPVLFMVGGEHKSSDLPRTVRICQELGADLVKINCSGDMFSVSNDADIAACLREGPPVLMAGGPVLIDLAVMAKNAAALGLAGYCVGRHIFRSENPALVAAELDSIFSAAMKRNQV